MMMISGNRRHRDRGNANAESESRAPADVTGGMGSEQRRDPAGGCVMVEVDIYEGLKNI
ncbi:MAG: hypothetical protein U9N46_04355 [Euryarchaeota archaeon]|nr:hypothetical protein [Euryarchaeota archaeon]